MWQGCCFFVEDSQVGYLTRRANRRGAMYNPATLPLTPGSKLGPYEILSLIGTGGMGEVYRARDSRLGRDVAIKILPASFSNDQDRLRRFEQEAQAVAALNHPNLLIV